MNFWPKWGDVKETFQANWGDFEEDCFANIVANLIDSEE